MLTSSMTPMMCSVSSEVSHFCSCFSVASCTLPPSNSRNPPFLKTYFKIIVFKVLTYLCFNIIKINLLFSAILYKKAKKLKSTIFQKRCKKTYLNIPRAGKAMRPCSLATFISLVVTKRTPISSRLSSIDSSLARIASQSSLSSSQLPLKNTETYS